MINCDFDTDTHTAKDYQQGHPHSTDLGIVQYNCGNANYRLARSVFDRLHPEKHYVIAIQEPYLNARARTTYCPPGYHLCYTAAPETRVYFLVSKRISTQEWRFHPSHADVASLTLRTTIRTVEIINVYNPSPTSLRSLTPSRLAEVRDALQRCSEHGNQPILLGDFNLHHPAWGGSQSGVHDLAEELLGLVEEHGLRILPPGEIA